MSQCIVPNWNLRHQRQEQVEGEERKTSPHVHSDQILSYVVPMSSYEVTELTWENGLPAMHGLGGILPSCSPQTKQTTWDKPGDHTLESIVHQATFNSFPQHARDDQNQEGNLSSIAASSSAKWSENSSHMQVEQSGGVKAVGSMPITSGGNWRESSSAHTEPKANGGKWGENLGHLQVVEEQNGVKILGSMAAPSGGKWGESSGFVNKRVRPETERKSSFQVEERASERSASASASAGATFCRDTDTTMMTWSSFESPRSLKSARNNDDDSACPHSPENQEGELMTKGESFRRRSRAAAIHNLSERRRRDRINEKMRNLQKLVPNASKTDKASMLDEVIEYLKQLQAQVLMMSIARNMHVPQMVMPAALGMQQQLQMSLLARMGMGMGMGVGMGMLDVNNLARNVPHSFPPLIHGGATNPSFVSPTFATPPVVPPPIPLKANVGDISVSNFDDVYRSYLAQQSMNVDFVNKMAALYRQEAGQPSKKPATSSQPSHGQAE